MCDFCENSKQIIQETNMSSIRLETYSVCIMKNELVFAGTVQDSLGITFPAETAKIFFCPICGRKLDEEKELPWVTVGYLEDDCK